MLMGMQAFSPPASVKQAQAQTSGSLPWLMPPTLHDGTLHVVSRLTLSAVGSPSDVEARRELGLWNLSILGVMETSNRYR